MKQKNQIIAIFLAGILLLTAGCGKSKDSPAESTVPAETTLQAQPSAPVSPEASLNSLRQAMIGTPQLFAVAYFGYHDTIDSDLPVDPHEIMLEYTYRLCQELPFLQDIPADRVIGNHGDLFCIVPLDENATVDIGKMAWDEDTEQYVYAKSLYFANTGEPILLFCNDSGWEPDTQVYLYGPSGETVWYPQIDDYQRVMLLCNDSGDDLLMDFSAYRELLMKRHRDMKDTEWSMPTAQMLCGSTWCWDGFLKDGREVSYELTFDENTLSVRWNDGIDAEDHIYPDAAWELNYDEGFAILTIDFREFAGMLRYNLLYHKDFDVLYVAMDAVQEELPIGWEPQYRFLNPPVAPEPVEMLGWWELAWTEVEGERIEAEPAACTVGIRMSASSGFLMSYFSREFPHNNFENESLTIDNREMYYGCGNDAWVGDLDYVGPWDTTYSVTLTSDDTLIKRNYYLLDGAPTVSHEYFWRIRESNTEDPYMDAVSQGWQVPELSQLMNTFWLSWNGYALELADDSVPGDNGGWAKLYDVDEIGAYTESYSGSWQYEDGLLYLSLVPANGNGVFVDDSFPVLMLDGELRIGRTANGTGLPHFYADTLMDTLEQPKG